MNVSIAKVFEMVNAISKFKCIDKSDGYAIREALLILIRVIEPMIPHLAEECWGLTGNQNSIIQEPWPSVNSSYLENEEVTIVIQINGKRRGEVLVKKDSTEADVKEEIKNIKNISDTLDKKRIKKTIYVLNKILNIVLDT